MKKIIKTENRFSFNAFQTMEILNKGMNKRRKLKGKLRIKEREKKKKKAAHLKFCYKMRLKSVSILSSDGEMFYFGELRYVLKLNSNRLQKMI